MRETLPKWFLYLIAAVAVVWLLQQAWQVFGVLYEVFLLFFLAWLLGFIMHPIIQRLQDGFSGRSGLPRVVAAAVVYLTILFAILIGLGLFVPTAINQITALVRQLPAWVAAMPDRATQVEEALARLGYEVDLDVIYRRVDLVATAQAFGARVTTELFRLATGVAGGVAAALLTLVISFYMYLDTPRIQRRFLRLAPATWREEIIYFDEVVNRVFGGYIRSQLIMALLTALGTFLVVVFAQEPFALATSLLAGALMLIPYLGPVIAFTIPVIIAWQQSGLTALLVAGALLLVHQTISRLIMPRVVSYTTGLPAILVLAGMLTGVRLFGIWGAIFGAPVVGILYTMVVFIYERRILPQRAASAIEAIDRRSPY